MPPRVAPWDEPASAGEPLRPELGEAVAGNHQEQQQNRARDRAAAAHPGAPAAVHRAPLQMRILVVHAPVSSRSVTSEQRVMEAIEAGRDRLVELTSTLINFDTTARERRRVGP